MMKNFLAILLALIITTMSITVVVKAAPNDPNGWSTDPVISALRQVIYETYGISLNDTLIQGLWITGFNPQDNYWLTFYGSSSRVDIIIAKPDSVIYDDTSYTLTQGGKRYYQRNDGTWDTTGVSASTYQLAAGQQILGKYSDIVTGSEYDYSIPNCNVGIISNVSGAPDSAIVPLKIRYNKILNTDPDTTQYRVELKGRFALPTIIDISKAGGSLNYQYSGYVWSDWVDIYTYDDNKHLAMSGVNKYDLALPLTITQWTNLCNAQISNVVFNWHYNELSVTKIAMENTYKGFNYPMAGIDPNKFDFYVRYTKVENGSVKYGKWTHLTNGDLSVINTPYENIPSIPVELPTGRSVLDTDQVENQINNNVKDPYIIPDINININTPDQNTLNYPTIATYNKDKLLVDTLEFANDMPNWFMTCVSAFSLCFSIIHPSIWVIIGFGFCLSIIVMVLKVL